MIPKTMAATRAAHIEAARRCADVALRKTRDPREVGIRCYVGGLRAAANRRKTDADRVRDLFVRWHLVHGVRPSAADMASRLGMRPKDIHAHLATMRRRAEEKR